MIKQFKIWNKSIQVQEATEDAGGLETGQDEPEPADENRVYSGPVGHVLKKVGIKQREYFLLKPKTAKTSYQYSYLNQRLREIEKHLMAMKSMTTANCSADFNRE